MRRPVLLLLLISILAASATAQSPRIIENPRPTWKPGEALVLSAAPTLVIGTQGGPDYELSRVRGAARLRDGRIVVADGGSLTLRFYDSAGRYLKSIGGKGGGPGEFEQLDSFWRLPGDTLVAGRMIRSDLTYFTGEGRFISRLTPAAPERASGMPIVLGVLGGGLRAVATVSRQDPKSTRTIDSFPVAIVDEHSAVLRRLGTLPYNALAPRGEMLRFAASAVFAADNKRFYFGYGADYAIRVYTRKGDLSHVVHRNWTPTKVSRADIEAYAIEWGKENIKTSGAEAAAERARIRNDDYASTVPAFSQFVTDPNGRLWVRAAQLADANGAGQLNTTPLVASTWSVFDAAGRWLGDVTMPARFLPRDIGADYVLGTALDADNVETVVMYRLAPRGAR